MPNRTVSVGQSEPYGLFVTKNGDIYVDNGTDNHRIDKWSLNVTNGIFVMNVTSRCRSLFIDINNTLYCSYDFEHKVVKAWLDNSSLGAILAAGNGSRGSKAHMLNGPIGIFVDFSLNLYVADHWNDRIQLFKPGQTNGTTKVGKGASGTIALKGPIAVILDADGYLYIVDHDNYRIIGSGPTGFRCLIGCSEESGEKSYQLYNPRAISFDSSGNIFVADGRSHRILKFALAGNYCGKAIDDFV